MAKTKYYVIASKSPRRVWVYFGKHVVMIFGYENDAIAYKPTIIPRHCEERSNLVCPETVLR